MKHLLPPLLTTLLIPCLLLCLSEKQSLAQANGITIARTLKVGELSRKYYLHIPAMLPARNALPLVLVFHGSGGKPSYVERETKFSELADREGFLVAYPEGIGKSWNDGRNSDAIPAQRDHIDDIGFIDALIEEIARAYTIDRKRIYATGMSNGATFSQRLAAMLSVKIAAIAPVAGGMPEPWANAFNPKSPVSVLILQGTDDPLVPYDGGRIAFTKLPFGKSRGTIIPTEETVNRWVTHNGCEQRSIAVELPDRDPEDGCRVKRFTYSKGRDGTEVSLLRFEGGGHTWPDGLQYLPRWFIGEVCRDINGTEIIWQFFRAHPKV